MGGVDIKQFGRWVDPTRDTPQSWMFLPAKVTGEAINIGKKVFDPKKPATPNVSTPPPPADLTDLTVQALSRAQAMRATRGSRRGSFLTGPLGDQTMIPTLGKSIISGG